MSVNILTEVVARPVALPPLTEAGCWPTRLRCVFKASRLIPFCSSDMKSSRHVKRQLKSVRKLRNSGVISLDYVRRAKNLADQFTKGLSRNVIDNASKELGW